MPIDNIINNRQALAASFTEKKEIAGRIESNLRSIEKTAYYEHFASAYSELTKKMSRFLDDLGSFSENIKDKIALYRNGVVTVSFSGVEKAGKTTFLKTLTGIRELPTGRNRCTAVSCEILYSEPEDEKFVVHYYSETELLELVKSQVKYIQKYNGVPVRWNGRDLYNEEDLSFLKLDNISTLEFESVENLRNGRDGLLGRVLERMNRIKACVQNGSYRNKLGTEESFTDFAKLPKYMAHPSSEDVDEITGDLILANEPDFGQPLVRIVKIYKNFQGGVRYLRLYDTPGVTDPDPIAKRQMMQAAKTETDMMIVASKCNEGQSDVQDALAKLTMKLGDLGMTDKMFFVVNYKATRADGQLVHQSKAADPSFWASEEHKKEITRFYPGTQPPVFGPYDASNVDDVNKLLADINARLFTLVEKQDEMVSNDVDTSWKELQKTRTDIVESLSRLLPNDESSAHAEIYQKYEEWFKMASVSTSSDSQNHFFDKLCNEMSNMTTSASNEDESLNTIIKAVKQIRSEAWNTIQRWLQENVTDEKCQSLLSGRRDNTHEKLLSGLAVEMSEIVNNIARLAEQIGPDIQKLVCDGICRALDVRTRGYNKGVPTISVNFVGNSDDAAKRLSTLCDKLERGTTNEDVMFLVSKLREIALISARAGYIMRYELRPALNLLDTFRWTAARKISLNKQVAKILQSAGNKHEKEQFVYMSSMDANQESDYVLPANYDWSQQVENTELKTLLEEIKRVYLQDEKTKEEFKEEYPGVYQGEHCKASPRVLCLRWLFDAILPSLGNSASEHTKFYYMLAYTSLLTIDAVLSSNEGKLAMLKEDFLAEASQTLCTQLRSENGWRNGLRYHIKDILGDEVAEQEKKSKNREEYRNLVDGLKREE